MVGLLAFTFVIQQSNAIGVHFYPIWESLGFDEWLYNGGTYQFCIFHFGMFIDFCAPVIAASAVFIVYPIGQSRYLLQIVY